MLLNVSDRTCRGPVPTHRARFLSEKSLSFQAISWVIEHSKHGLGDLVVLLMIASHAHSDGTGAFPSTKTLARESRLTKRQVYRCLLRLEKSGELQIQRRTRRTSLYSLPGVKLSLGRCQDVTRVVTPMSPEPSFNRPFNKDKECPTCGLSFPPIAYKRHFCDPRLKTG